MIRKLLLSLLAIFGFTFLLSSDSFADSPSYTISSDPGSSVFLCDNDPNTSFTVFSASCSDYLYLNVEFTGVASARLQLWSSSNRNFPINSDVMDTFAIKMSSTLTQVTLPAGYFVFSDGGSITFSLSDTPIGSTGIVPSGSLSITENGTYDVTNYAEAVVNVPMPECEDCDKNFIVSAFETIFINFAVNVIPLCAIVFVVCFMIDMITSFVYGRGR